MGGPPRKVPTDRWQTNPYGWSDDMDKQRHDRFWDGGRWPIVIFTLSMLTYSSIILGLAGADVQQPPFDGWLLALLPIYLLAVTILPVAGICVGWFLVVRLIWGRLTPDVTFSCPTIQYANDFLDFYGHLVKRYQLKAGSGRYSHLLQIWYQDDD